MNDNKFAGKYRIPTARARWWDYADQAAYFVTICTAQREWFFGEVVNDEMVLSELGRVAESEWLKSFELRPDMNLQIDEYKVMPNHFHAIVIVGNNRFNTVESSYKNKFGPQSKNLGSMIRGYKSAVKSYATTNGLSFGWQSRFHDHIIRDDEEYQRIAEYIHTNPTNWQQDIHNGRIL
jgi:REP element-mobilizing transposase RayT